MLPNNEMQLRNVAILLFDDMRALDFIGPFEVFSIASELNAYKPFRMMTVAAEKRVIVARNGLSINPEHAINSNPMAEIVIIPGGIGTKQAMLDESVIAWVQAVATQAEYVLSVCTGARILAKAGLLDGLRATTHHEALESLRELAPKADWQETDWLETRFIDNGKVITSGGVSAGIDMSLHVVSKLLGRDKARATADYMEYEAKGLETV
jgi:transcriptional regulator GlxA family with amidase domain